MEIGEDVEIGDNCVLEVSVLPKAVLRIGAHSWVSHDCHISSYGEISIGSYVLIGEFVSIRDSSHSYANRDTVIKLQNDTIGSVIIEDDVWIGRGTIILGKPDGLRIGKGAVIGANSVVNRSIPAMQVWGGVPSRFIKKRG